MSLTSLPHVDEPRYLALHGRLATLSRVSTDFVVLLSGSTLIATLGLFQNSPAVIIGAMIIAPLMRPLVGLSLSTLTADGKLLIGAGTTLIVGTVAGAAISATMAAVLGALALTPEILARTHPTLLDLGVALFAGAIGAYCQTDERLADSLAGVAIAVALVPPLSVVGIGLAHNNVPVWSGALLLYATNLVGITFAGALVFLLMGFTPLHRARKGLALSAVAMALLLVPLGFSMWELVMENQLRMKIRQMLSEKTFTFRGLQVHDVQVRRFRRPVSVVATVLSSGRPITARQVKLVQDFLSREIGMAVDFRLRMIPATEIEAHALTPDDPPAGEGAGAAPGSVPGPAGSIKLP